MEIRELTVRRATDADWAQIWPIWHAIVAAGETYTWDPATGEAEARRVWMLPEPAEVWVAEQTSTREDPSARDTEDPSAVEDTSAGVIQGTALLKPNQPGLGGHIANAGFMVARGAAGKGIGRALGERIVERARELGYRGMQFNAVVSTNTRAVGLWKSLGFEIVGTVPGAFRHARLGYVDLHIMYRQL